MKGKGVLTWRSPFQDSNVPIANLWNHKATQNFGAGTELFLAEIDTPERPSLAMEDGVVLRLGP